MLRIKCQEKENVPVRHRRLLWSVKRKKADGLLLAIANRGSFEKPGRCTVALCGRTGELCILIMIVALYVQAVE